MSTEPSPYLVLGIGNLLLRDEGVGIHVVQSLLATPLGDDVEVADGGTGGADLVDLIADRRKVVVVDAVDAGVEPGRILRLRPQNLLPGEGEMISLHQLGLVESLDMAGQLGCQPDDVVIIAIQPGDLSPGLDLSEEVAAALPAAVRAVLAELPRQCAARGWLAVCRSRTDLQSVRTL